jgi:AcrR family transcriptional regulator
VAKRGTATRDAIVDTALRLFAERGYPAVRVEDVARAAGVSRATFYNHFSERDEILAALLQRLLGDGEEADAGDPALPPLERVHLVARSATSRIIANEALARFVYTLPVRHDSLLKPDVAATPAAFRTIHHLIEEAAERGDVRVDVPIDLVCAHVHNALETAVRAWAEGRTDDPLGYLEILLDLALHGVVASDRRGSSPRQPATRTSARASSAT